MANSFLSEGVKREVELAIRLGKKIFYIIPQGEAFHIITHFTSLEELFGEDNEKEEVVEECIKEEVSEEKSHPEEKATSIFLGRLLDNLRTGQESHS